MPDALRSVERRLPGWRVRIALLGCGLLLGLLFLELTVRWLPVGPRLQSVRRESYRLSENPVLQYELRPGSRVGPVVVNARGMRGPEITLEKPAGTFRIACVGNSICFGYGVGPGACYADRLESLLRENFGRPGRDFEALNLGVTGYNLPQIVETVRARALEFEPDLVLYGYCLNDPQGYSFELETLREQLTHAERDYLQRLRSGGRSLVLRSRLLTLLRYAWQARSEDGRRRETARPEPDWASLQRPDWAGYFRDLHAPSGSWETVLSSLNRLAAVSRANDLPVVLALFPVLRDLREHPLAEVHARLAECARLRGFAMIDLTRLFAALEVVAPGRAAFDELHPSAFGHEMAALRIFLALARSGALPLGSEELHDLLASEGPLGETLRWIDSLEQPSPSPSDSH